MPRVKSNKPVKCDCPFCPLIKAELRCEDVILEMGDPVGFRIANTGINNLTKDLHIHLYVLCLWVKNNHNLPVGETYYESKKTHMLEIERVKEKLFLISFHCH